jgi:hypothetical protein
MASALALGLLVDIEIDFSTRNGNARVFINKAFSTQTVIIKTLSTVTAYQQG